MRHRSGPDDRHPRRDPKAQIVLKDNHITGNRVVPVGGVLIHEELVDALRIGQPTLDDSGNVDIAKLMGRLSNPEFGEQIRALLR